MSIPIPNLELGFTDITKTISRAVAEGRRSFTYDNSVRIGDSALKGNKTVIQKLIDLLPIALVGLMVLFGVKLWRR